MQTKIVDVHPHITSADINRYPITPVGGNRSAWSEKRRATIEELIVAMDEAGVDKAAIVQSVSTHGYDCSYLADSVALQSPRCTGVFSADMMAADAPEKIRYWVKERKLSGLRVYTGGLTNKQSTSLSDPKTFPGWGKRARARDPGVCFVASGGPAAADGAHQTVSPGAHHRRPSDGRAHRGRSALHRGGVCVRFGPLWGHVS